MSDTNIETTEYSELDVVKTFMKDVDVVSSVRKLDSVSDYLELLELFYTDGKTKLPLLSSLIEGSDLGRYTIEVHGLKSASANIGANILSSVSHEHEDAGKAEQTKWITDNIDDLNTKYDALLQEIRRVLELWEYEGFVRIDNALLPPIEDDELTDRLTRALGFLEDFESKEAAREVDELMGFALDDDARRILDTVRSFLKVYDDDRAEELLRSMI